MRLAGLAACAILPLAGPAAAESGSPLTPPPAASFGVWLKSDAIASQKWGVDYVDVLGSTMDADLGRSIGWRGANAHAELVHTFALSGSGLPQGLQSIDNDDVRTRHFRVYEAWIEQRIARGRASLLAGVYDPRTEFGALDAAGLLVNPSFGLNPELADSGPHGAPTFPSTSMAARVRIEPRPDAYLMAALIDARPGGLGDPGGVDRSLRDGELFMGEAGFSGAGKLAVGAWGFTRTGPAAGKTTGAFGPQYRPTRGVYALVEKRLASGSDPGPQAALFARAGLTNTDGSSPAGSWQAGVRVENVFANRPESVLSLGFARSMEPRRRPDPWGRATPPNAAVEVSYSDRIAPMMVLQPDLQWVRRAGGGRLARNSLAFLLRATFELPSLTWRPGEHR